LNASISEDRVPTDVELPDLKPTKAVVVKKYTIASMYRDRSSLKNVDKTNTERTAKMNIARNTLSQTVMSSTYPL
jgi:hypothetical protein